MNERESGEELGHFKRIYALRVALCVESRNNGRLRYIILKQAISPSRGYKGDPLIKVLANFVRYSVRNEVKHVQTPFEEVKSFCYRRFASFLTL
jgi:hypothetical protein